MQPDKMLSVECQHNTVFIASKLQHLVVRNGLFGLAGFLSGQDIVPKPAQF